MKKIAAIIAFIGLYSSFAQQPITLTRADFPKPTSGSQLPDSVQYIALTRPNKAPTTISGANESWSINYTGTPRFQNFLPMSATPLVFQVAFLTCDYAQPLANGTSNNGFSGGLNATDMYEYFNYTSGNSRLESKGFGANVTMPGSTTALPLAAVFSSPDVLYRFPLNYGDMDSSTSGFDVSIPGTPIGTVQIKRDQKRVNHVDAWGSITLPSGTFDVLRVQSVIDRIDSFKSGMFTYGTPSKPAEYKWIAAGKKIPVLQINGTIDPANNTFNSSNGMMWTEQPTGINDIADGSMELIAFPNPFMENIAISYTLLQKEKVTIIVNNSMGQKVAEFHFDKAAGNHADILPIQQLPKGNYHIICIAGQKTIAVKTVKF